MCKRVFHSLQALLVLTAPALACYPDPEFSYHDVSSRDVAIATATVTSVEFESSETKSCWRVHYLDVQYLYGVGEKEFSVKTCSDKIYQLEALSEELEGLEYLGFVPEAEVLLGLISLDQENSEVMYAIPSCWGPLHYNLGKMSSEERAKLLRELDNQIEKTQ